MKKKFDKDLRTGVAATITSITIVTLCLLCVTSCNVTRTITTASEYFQKGDTTCTIVTKTVETYDATKK